VTGTPIVQLELTSKRLELLKEVVPGLKRVAALQDTATVPAPLRANNLRPFEEPTRALRLEPQWCEFSDLGELDDRLKTMVAQRAQAVIVFGSPFTFNNAQPIVELVGRPWGGPLRA
jgi:putative ABC transport system substrate-binding protein